MRLHMLGILTATSVVVGVLVVAPTTTAGAQVGGTVHVSGTANCKYGGAPALASRVRIQAANGEAAESSVNLFGQYSMTFTRVPKAGETANAYVFCKNVGAEVLDWGRTIKLGTRGAVSRQTVNLTK